MAELPYTDANQQAEETIIAAPEPPNMRRSLLRGALIIALGAVLTRVLGLGRESILAGIAGTGAPADAFRTADTTLNTLYDFLVSGMISAALVPVLTQYAPRKGDPQTTRDDFGRIISTLLTGGIILFGITICVLELSAPPLTSFLTGGNEEVRSLTFDLLRLLIPGFLFLGLSALLMATHQSLQRFQYSALPAGARNASVIIFGLLLGSAIGVHSLVIGVLVGSAIIVIIQFYGLRDIRLRPTFRAADWQHPAIRRILRLYLPIFLGLAVTVVGTFIDRRLANGVSKGSVSSMGYATTVQQFALGLIAVAIAQAILPSLSRMAAEADWQGYERTFALGLRTMAALIFPATLGLLALGLPLIGLLFQRGAFTDDSRLLVYAALLGYLPGLPAAAFDQLLIFGFYARKNAIAPVLVGVVSDLCLIAIEFALVAPYGFIGLVLANSARQIIHLGIMIVLTRHWQRRYGESAGSGSRAFLNIGLAALLMGAVAGLVGGIVLSLLHGWGTDDTRPSLLANIAAVVVGGGAGGGAYLFGLWRLRVDELSRMFGGITTKFRRR